MSSSSTDIEKLKNSNLELKEMINNSWDGIAIIDSNSKLIFVNDAFIPMLGFPKAELLSNNITDFMNNEYKDSFLQLLSTNKKNSYFTDINVVCRRKDGKPIYLKVTVSLMLNKKYFVINAKDITKQISDDEILNNYVISSHTDISGTITEVSDAFCKLTGYTKDELIGNTHTIIKHPDSKNELFSNLWNSIKSGKEWSGRIKNRKKNGDTFWVDVKIKPIYNKYGDITGFTSLMFDITNELILDQKVIDQDYKISIMNETIKTISHEWRQPLNSISIIAQKMALELEDNKTLQDELEKIKHNLFTLSNTIEDFRKIVDFKGEKEHIIFDKLIETLIKPYKNMTKFELDIDKNITLYSYEESLISIFNCIIKNSIEAFIKNQISDKLIKISLKNSQKDINITIEDNAGGISDNIINKVFEPYFSTKEQKHGVGLGLYTSKNILELHLNGSINIESVDDKTIVKIKIIKNEDK